MTFLEISQNSQESTCARVFFFIKIAGLKPFLQNISGRLLLLIKRLASAKQLNCRKTPSRMFPKEHFQDCNFSQCFWVLRVYSGKKNFHPGNAEWPETFIKENDKPRITNILSIICLVQLKRKTSK